MGLREEFNAIDYVALSIMALNISSSVGVVFFNKWLFQFLEFTFSYSLVMFHFIFTSFGLGLCFLFKIFEFKKIPIIAMIPLSGSFCGFVLLTNISLLYNSVGFYQICKVLTTPTILIIQLILFNQRNTLNTVISLIIVCIGVIITTTSDIQTSIFGTVIALTGVLVTSFYQIWVGQYHKKYNVNSPQLLIYQAPISSIMLAIFWPLMEDTENFYNYNFNNTEFMILLSLSCFAALFVNLSTFLLIGRTSALTYNAVGHFKLTLILTGGFILFDQYINFGNIFGTIVTLIGLIAYTKEKLKQQAIQKNENILPVTTRTQNEPGN